MKLILVTLGSKLLLFFNRIALIVKASLWTKISGTIFFIATLCALFTDVIQINSMFSDNNKKNELISDSSKTPIINKNNNISSKNKVNSLSNASTSTDKKPNKPTKKYEIDKNKNVSYFNTNETLLENKSIALFITGENNKIDLDFQYRMVNHFNSKNIKASASFFNKDVLQHYNKLYSANKNWLTSIKIDKYINTYLIGNIKMDTLNSSIDTKVSIVKLIFRGKVVNLKTNKSTPIEKEISESNYRKDKALEAACRRLSEEIIKII